jgi:hypothetical protein
MLDPDEFDAKWVALTEKIEAALSEGLHEFDGLMLTKYVTVFEFMDQDGDRGCLTISTADLMRWDVLGMLHFSIQNDNAHALYEVVQRHSEDDD